MPRTIKSNEDAAGQIRREALAAGASSITLCTQAYGELKKYITEQGQGGGICRSLSMAWLEGRKTGVNFLQKMLGPGGTIKVGEVLPMCQAYKAAGELSIDEQQALIIANLTAKGLASTGAEKLTQVGGGSNVSAWFTQNSAMSGIGQLRSVNVFGGYNHAMAMDISQQYAIFFDPNWGAFTFPTHLKMVAFLEKSTFVLSGGKFHYADVKEFRNAMKICFL